MAVVQFQRRPKPSGRARVRRRRRTLGDKLQLLAHTAPNHLKAVETFVDLILKRMSNTTMMLALVLLT